jgi:pyoverdine/dityrosine biosynthesis protein Dit1
MTATDEHEFLLDDSILIDLDLSYRKNSKLINKKAKILVSQNKSASIFFEGEEPLHLKIKVKKKSAINQPNTSL